VVLFGLELSELLRTMMDKIMTKYPVIVFFLSLFNLVFGCVALGCFEPNTLIERHAQGSVREKELYGPTIYMEYGCGDAKLNPIEDFMYFVPLVARTAVSTTVSANNKQVAEIISWKKEITDGLFKVLCEFEMKGGGFYEAVFDPNEMIAEYSRYFERGENLENMLDFIRFEGDCFGLIEIEGQVLELVEKVTKVRIHFDGKAHKSPVTIGMYNVRFVEGGYNNGNRCDEKIVRVKNLTFTKSSRVPRMVVQVSSLTAREESEGLWSAIKAVVANFFIKPMPVSEIGNETMLEFGGVLLEKQSCFAFQKAQNLRTHRRESDV
jgi:hypothetical protein